MIVCAIWSLIATLFYVCRSEIHEKMQCTRCPTYDDRSQIADGNYTAQATLRNGESDEETSDIGGFAETAGCLQKLRRSEKQVGYYIVVLIMVSKL